MLQEGPDLARLSSLTDDARWLVLQHTSRNGKLSLRALNREWCAAVLALASFEKCTLHHVLQRMHLPTDVKEVQKHLRIYDARRSRPDSKLPDESVLLAQSLYNGHHCACFDNHEENDYGLEGCPFRCCRQVKALMQALNAQWRRDRLSQWLAQGTTRWRTIDQIEACEPAAKVCSQLLSPKRTMPPFGLRAVALALERLECFWFVMDHSCSACWQVLEIWQLEKLTETIEARWTNAQGQCLLGSEGTAALKTRLGGNQVAARAESPRGKVLCRRDRTWSRFVGEELPRGDCAPEDPPFLTACERLVDNMLVWRLDEAEIERREELEFAD